MECVSVKKMVEGGLRDLTGITHIVVVLYKLFSRRYKFLDWVCVLSDQIIT